MTPLNVADDDDASSSAAADDGDVVIRSSDIEVCIVHSCWLKVKIRKIL